VTQQRRQDFDEGDISAVGNVLGGGRAVI